MMPPPFAVAAFYNPPPNIAWTVVAATDDANPESGLDAVFHHFGPTQN
jgi:hypothetical protein